MWSYVVIFAIAIFGCVAIDCYYWHKDKPKIVKTIRETDTQFAEAYSLCDRCPNDYHRSQLRSIVDGLVKQIQEDESRNHVHAAIESRRRLGEQIKRMKMGS